jgi:hypothetical protein
MTTGPLHWQLLVRSRALDSQLWVAAVCCARDATAGYVAYGHSMLVGPMGNVVAQAQELATIVEGDVVLQQCVEVLPFLPRGMCTRIISSHNPLPPPPTRPRCCASRSRRGRISLSSPSCVPTCTVHLRLSDT